MVHAKFSHRTLETCQLKNQFFLSTTVVSVCVSSVVSESWWVGGEFSGNPSVLLHRAPAVIETCMTLHNLCIDRSVPQEIRPPKQSRSCNPLHCPHINNNNPQEGRFKFGRVVPSRS